MTSYFQRARQTVEEDFDKPTSPIFEEVKRHKKENVIPPVGLAKPELVKSFMQNMDDEDKILQDIADIESYERESPWQTGLRETAAHTARAVEGVLGGIGSIINAVFPPIAYGIDSETGELQEWGKNAFPSSEKLHDYTKEMTGTYLEPKSDFTKASQETVSDIGSMFSTGSRNLWAKLLTPIGGQITKQVIKQAGGSEKAQDLGKLGFMALSTISQMGNAPQAARQAMNQAEQMIPQGINFNAAPIENALQNLRNTNWYRSGNTASKAPAFRELERVEQAIHNGQIDGRLAMQLRRDVNEARRALGGFQLNPIPDKAAARYYLDQVDNALLAGMEQYGTKVNPAWWDQYQLANQAFAVTQRSRLIGDFIDRHAKPLKSDLAKNLFHITGAGAVGALPAIGAAAIPVMGATQSIQIMNRLIRSPILRNHYADVLRAASQENAAMLNKALEKFDKAAQKEDEKLKTNILGL